MKTIQLSKSLKELLDELSQAVSSVADLLERIKGQAEHDGLSLKDTRELVIQALKKRGLADRTIRKWMPDNLKNKRAQDIGAKGNSARRKPAADDAATVGNTNQDATPKLPPQPRPGGNKDDFEAALLAENFELKQRVREQEGIIKQLREENERLRLPFDAPTTIDFAGKRLKGASAHVRPANREVPLVTVPEAVIPAGAF